MKSREMVSRYFEYVNTDQFHRLRELFAADVVLDMAGASERIGIEAALDYYPRALEPLPRHFDDPVDVVASEDGKRVVAEIAFTGETADGRPVEFTAVDLFDFDNDGCVVRLRSFYDTALVARLLHEPPNTR